MFSSMFIAFVLATGIVSASQDTYYPTRPVGIADIVAFGSDGTYVLRNSINPIPRLATTEYGSNTGWVTERHLRFVADVTGDGNGDVVAFGEAAVYVSQNDGRNGFGQINTVLEDFVETTGWTLPTNPRFVADLRKKGRVDLLGFGGAGVFVSQNNGNLDFTDAALVVQDFGTAQGWTPDRHIRLLADVNGDGFPDIVGFGEWNVSISLNNGDGTFQASAPVLATFTIGNGNWTISQNPRLLADLTGDGSSDIVGFGADGVYVSLNNGKGSFSQPTKVVDSFSVAQGWTVAEYPRVVADITGDGLPDIVGFGEAGVWTSINLGGGAFKPVQFALNTFGHGAGGWLVEQHPRFVADLDGDGKADILGFGQNGVYVSFSNGDGTFKTPIVLTTSFTADQGWTVSENVRNPTNLYA